MSGRVEESVATLERALVEAPEYTASWLALAIGYWELGRADVARRFGQKLLSREPGMTIAGTIRDTLLIVPDQLGKIELACVVPEYRSDQRRCKSRSTARRASSRRACAAKISSGVRRMALR